MPGLFLAFGVAVAIIVFVAVACGVFIVTTGMRAVAVMGLAEFLGFVPLVALAGNEHGGGKNEQHRENFHLAP